MKGLNRAVSALRSDCAQIGSGCQIDYCVQEFIDRSLVERVVQAPEFLERHLAREELEVDAAGDVFELSVLGEGLQQAQVARQRAADGLGLARGLAVVLRDQLVEFQQTLPVVGVERLGTALDVDVGADGDFVVGHARGKQRQQNDPADTGAMPHDCPECPATLESFDELHDHVNDEHDLVDRALEHGAADGGLSIGPLRINWGGWS